MILVTSLGRGNVKAAMKAIRENHFQSREQKLWPGDRPSIPKSQVNLQGTIPRKAGSPEIILTKAYLRISFLAHLNESDKKSVYRKKKRTS